MKQFICIALFILVTTSAWGDAGWAPDDPLMPMGDSTQDTQNLRLALHDSRLDNGGTLYLGQGTFHVHGTLGRQSLDPSSQTYSTTRFNGTIQGAGKEITVIKAVKGPGGAYFEPISYAWPGDPESVRDYSLLVVEQTYLGLKDLTFDSEPEILDDPTNGWWFGRSHNLYDGKGPTAYAGTGTLIGSPIELIGTDIKNVRFKGALDADGHPVTGHLYQHWGDDGGVHNVTNSEFENSISGALQFLGIFDATINVGGSPKNQVGFTNTPGGGLQVSCLDCALNVSHVRTANAPAVGFVANSLYRRSTLSISHSEIDTSPNSYYAGIELWGIVGDFSYVIEKNTFHSEDAWLRGAIFSERSNAEGLIANNKFTGWGPAAMYLGVYAWRPGSVMIRGNNLDNWETTPDPWGLGTAPIWLGPFVINSQVIGGDNAVNVFDEPAYDTAWTPLYDDEGNPLTVPGYGDLIPPEEIGNLVPKNNTFTGIE